MSSGQQLSCASCHKVSLFDFSGFFRMQDQYLAIAVAARKVSVAEKTEGSHQIV